MKNSMDKMNGVERIEAAFANEDSVIKRPLFMPYFTLGYPDYDESLAVVEACAAAGADMMELGIPFSDPLADGPTIQHSTQVALENGMTVEKCLTAVAALRARNIHIPFLLMGYINPIMAYGIKRFVADAAKAGADGFIIPDLPMDEAAELIFHCRRHNMATIFLVAPNSPPERIKIAVKLSSGFTYLVSVMGVTGARRNVASDLADFAARVHAAGEGRSAVGFGISTPEQAAQVGQLADGVIVGSALIKAVDAADDKAAAAYNFVAQFR